MIKAIVFDCFGVLVNDGWLPFKRTYFAHDQSLFLEATDINKAVDAGLISYDDFVEQVAMLAGIDTARARREIEQNPADTDLFSFIARELKPVYAIGLLSNAGANWLDTLFTKEQRALFDATALSYELGMIKPDAGCYQTIAARLGVLPEECIFIDDQERYCTGAIDVGMQAIRFTDTPNLVAQLKTALQLATT